MLYWNMTDLCLILYGARGEKRWMEKCNDARGMIMCQEPLCMFYCTGACMDILYINLLACMTIM